LVNDAQTCSPADTHNKGATHGIRSDQAQSPKRTEAGLTEKYVLRGADDANEVVMFFEAQDLNRAKAFMASADLREKMQEVGVIDKPDIYFLNR